MASPTALIELAIDHSDSCTLFIWATVKREHKVHWCLRSKTKSKICPPSVSQSPRSELYRTQEHFKIL